MTPSSTNSSHVVRWPHTVHGHLRRLLGNLEQPGLVAVSGGADSVALLRALATTIAAPLHVVHVNHQLRGAAADADADFVAQLCPQLPHHERRSDVAARAQAHGQNLEATARHVRYEYFAELAQQLQVGWVATAHTLDDQAETVLHRLLRGTSVRGLRGIAPVRELAPGIALVRPILTETRAAVIDYLTGLGQPWRDDATNADPTYTRNRIRHELLPHLRTYNPAITTVLGQLAEQAHALFADLEATVTGVMHAAELPKAGSWCIFRAPVLATTPIHHLRELFNVLWEREGWPRNKMTFALWNRVAAVAQGQHAAWDLPDGLRITHHATVVRVGPRV